MMDPFGGKAIVTPNEIQDLERKANPPPEPKIILSR